MSSSRLVVNASPVISLSRIGCANVLLDLFSEVVVPQGVIDEVGAGPKDDPAQTWLDSVRGIVVRTVAVPPAINEWNLGRGESEVLAFAHANPGYAVSIDDKPARRCAESLEIKVHGTLAILIAAKKRGLVSNLDFLLKDLRNNGFRISHDVFNRALRMAREK